MPMYHTVIQLNNFRECKNKHLHCEITRKQLILHKVINQIISHIISALQ